MLKTNHYKKREILNLAGYSSRMIWSLLKNKNKVISAKERIESFPSSACEVLKSAVTIRWNEYQVPYILADNDTDAAFALGTTHAHLRLAQIEVAKRLARGRLSEMFGPFMWDVDEALRILAPARAAKRVIDQMPPTTKSWLDAFVAGINHYKQNLTPENTPHEYKLLGMDPTEPWTAEDSIAVGRLFGTDVHWLTWLEQLPESTQEDFARIWSYMHEVGGNGEVSFKPSKGGPIAKAKKDLAKLKNILRDTQRSGSNSLVIAKEKSETGSALIANDPHLGFIIPNAWFVAAVKCPSYHIVGMMPTGVPVFGFGRTKHFSWGGTNMRAISSDMVDVTDQVKQNIVSHDEVIKTRFFWNKKIKVRNTPHGPIVSDAKIFPAPKGRDIAIRWIGHELSDETTSLLNVAGATTWEEFLNALPNFAIPPQNFLFAGVKGDIGYALATRLPKRTPEHKDYLIHPFDVYQKGWEEILDASTLPHAYQPEEGFLASANNRPTETDYPIGYFFPQDERIRRLKSRVATVEKWSVAQLKRLQRDCVSLTSLELKDMIFSKCKPFEEEWGDHLNEVVSILKEWDGSYDKDSKGAYLFTAFLIEFAPRLYNKIDRPDDYENFKNDAYFRDLLKRDIHKINSKKLAKYTRKSLDAILPYLNDGKKWGDIQRMRLYHFLGRAPLLKYLYKVHDFAHGGTRETIMKAAHPLTMDEHRTYYGAQSRHISDMADQDENYFVLAGGQDGFPNSQNFMDQAELFVRGDYIKIPMTKEKVEELFTYVTTLKP